MVAGEFRKYSDEEIKHLQEVELMIFEGDQVNFKITRPFDIMLAESMFKG